MTIQKADIEKDAQILFELDNRAFNRAFDLPSRNIQEQKDYLRGSEVYIFYKDRQPVGFFAYKKDDNKVEIKSIVVVPEEQGKGIGKKMMQKLFELLPNIQMTLVTHPKNRSAIVYYLKSGFEIYGWKENYYGDGEPRLLLKLVR